MINLFALSNMEYTPFDPKFYDANFFNRQGIILSTDESKADVYITRQMPVRNKRDLLFFRLKHKRFSPILIWTHEPRLDTQFYSFLKGSLYFPDVNIMNTYTGDVYLDNYTWFGGVIDRELKNITEEHFFKRTKLAVGINGYISDTANRMLIYNGRNIDLSVDRQRILEYGHKNGFLDIYGKFWPGNISLEDSRTDENWHERKLELLRPYKFYIALENTNFSYYVSEKIWDSINGGCLPVYYGANNSIHKDFEPGSFIDYKDFEDPLMLFKYILAISADEYCDRLNRCINVFNKIFKSGLIEESKMKALNKIVEKINKIASKS